MKKKQSYTAALVLVFTIIQSLFCNIIPIYAYAKGELYVQGLVEIKGYKYKTELSGVASDKSFAITFTQPVDFSTLEGNDGINNNIELIERDSGELIDISLKKINYKKVRVIPNEPLISGLTYYLIVHDTIKNYDGKKNLGSGVIKSISVGDANFGFYVQSANFISPCEVKLKFNTFVDINSAQEESNYKVNDKKVYFAEVLEDGCSVLLTLESDVQNETNKVNISSDLLNIYKQKLGSIYTKNITVINKEGDFSGNGAYAYEKKTIDGNISILAKNVNLKNVDVLGYIYIQNKDTTISDAIARGSIYIDNPYYGDTNITDVVASKAEILSSDENSTINLKEVIMHALSSNSNNKVNIKTEGSTKIFKTQLTFPSASTVHLESGGDKEDAFGSITISDESKEKGDLKLKGDFSKPIRISSGASVTNEDGVVDKLEIAMNIRDSVTLSGKYSNVEINKPAVVLMNKSDVENVYLNASWISVYKEGTEDSSVESWYEKKGVKHIDIDEYFTNYHKLTAIKFTIIDKNTVEVLFNRALKESDYDISKFEFDNDLQITGVSLKPNSGDKIVILTTSDQQEGIKYKLKYDGVEVPSEVINTKKAKAIVDVELAAMNFKRIKVKSTDAPGGVKFKVEGNDTIKNIGETMTAMLNMQETTLYILDKDGNTITKGTLDLSKSETDINVELDLEIGEVSGDGTADINVVLAAMNFKKITLKSMDIPSGSKFKIEGNTTIKNIGETMTVMLNANETTIYILDSSENVLSSGTLDLSKSQDITINVK